MKFNSQICTSREQSERLIALGLKKETADMCSVIDHVSDGGEWEEVDTIFSFTPDDWNFRESVIPRWSLHRLIEMIQEVCPQVVIIFHRVDIRSNVKRIAYSFDVCDNLYDNIIDCIEWLIKEGYFPKEYLEE